MNLTKKDVLRMAKRIISLESRAVAHQARHVDESFWKAAQALAKCRGRLVVMGIGKSGLVGRKISATFASTGTPSFFLHPTEGLHGDLGMVAPGDVVLALSYSGETEELKKVLSIMRTQNVTLIAMTGRAQSILGRSANMVLCVAVEREACPYNVAPTSSTTAMLAMGDALALVVMEMKGFSQNDFARLHPGGALGKRLTMRVKDLMHKGSGNPLVSENKLVREALWVMTRTRLGAATIVDKKGKLAGVFTDGDLRRGLQKDAFLLNRRLRDVMTRSPRTVKAEHLASDVAGLFREYGLDNFPVVDGAGRPVGILDEKDLLDEGLV